MRKRLIGVAIILLAAIPFLIIGGIPYAIGIGLISLVAYKEIIYLKSSTEKPLPISVVFLGLAAFLSIVYSNFDGNNLILGLNYQTIAISTLLIMIPIIFIGNKEKYNTSRAFKLLGLVLMIGLGFNLLISVFIYDKNVFFYLVAITVFTDTFAYLSGSLIGKHKIAPNISPKKSWEGCIIGSLLGTIVSVFVYINLVSNDINLLTIIFITLFLSILGQLGDLFFSAIKREYNIKDYSNLIPGHGGILDRLDSIIFVFIGYLLFHIYL